MLVNFVFIATFVIKIKKEREKSGKHLKLVTRASIVRWAIYVVRTVPILKFSPPPLPPSPPPTPLLRIFLMANGP